jgi:hypothetical protein
LVREKIIVSFNSELIEAAKDKVPMNYIKSEAFHMGHDMGLVDGNLTLLGT